MARHRLIDLMDDGGPNELWCACGERLWPDCDISLASINEAFEKHLADLGVCVVCRNRDMVPWMQQIHGVWYLRGDMCPLHEQRGEV